MNNMEEIDKFLEKYNHPKLNQEEKENLNRSLRSIEIEANQKSSKKKKKKKPRTRWLHR